MLWPETALPVYLRNNQRIFELMRDTAIKEKRTYMFGCLDWKGTPPNFNPFNAIAGMGPGDCSSTFGNANEATRLKAFVQQAGANARMSSICDGDLSTSLAQTLSLFESACGGIIF